MRREVMDATLRAELARIPRGELDQNVLRAIYNMQRRHDLARDSSASKEEALRVSIEDVRRRSPGFTPAFERDFFHI